jgi:transcriptional regulator with XRE-family HTH domain
MTSELEALGARIASCRGTRSQRDLALETGLDVSTISRIERGITDPTYGTLVKIRKALNVPWDALVLDTADRGVAGDRPG